MQWFLIGLGLAIPVLIALGLNRREPRARKGEYQDNEDPRFDAMNKQGLGWGTRDNDRGGLQ